MPSDIEIAQAAKLKRIAQVAKEKLGISDEHLEPYGHFKVAADLACNHADRVFWFREPFDDLSLLRDS